jgi:hypothetical protein
MLAITETSSIHQSLWPPRVFQQAKAIPIISALTDHS